MELVYVYGKSINKMKDEKMIPGLQIVIDSWMNFIVVFLNNVFKYIRSVFFN